MTPLEFPSTTSTSLPRLLIPDPALPRMTEAAVLHVRTCIREVKTILTHLNEHLLILTTRSHL